MGTIDHNPDLTKISCVHGSHFYGFMGPIFMGLWDLFSRV